METTPHIHALIVPKFWNEERKLYELKNARYFDGKEKMSLWQDNYTSYMCKDLNNVFMRGIKGSKATHIELQTYYNLIKEEMDEIKAESIAAHAKENHLNKKKVEELKATLKGQEATIAACDKIIKANKDLKSSKALYEYTIKTLANKYKIPDKEVVKILDSKKAKEVQQQQKKQQRER